MKTFQEYEREAKKIVEGFVFTNKADIPRAIGKVMINLIGNDSKSMTWSYEKSLRDRVWIKYLR